MLRVLTDYDVEKGFWCVKPHENFPPTVTPVPEEYDGGPLLNVVCTQTHLPAHKQSKLVARWCEALPTLERLQLIWLNSKVPQSLFDAACRVPHLDGLSVKWSSVKCIDRIAECQNLRFLHLGSSTQLTSLEPLSALTNLIWLELENIKRVSDMTVVAKLPQLQGLSLSGSMWATWAVDSLTPLRELRSLRHLALPNLKAKDNTLRPLFHLRSLEQFRAAKWWSKEEVDQLRRANPKLTN